MIEIDLKRVQGDFNLQIQCSIDAQVTGLFGPSGAGKSTLLAMIAGLTKPSEGHIIIDGEVLFDSKCNINIPLHQRRIGTVFQDSRLFPHLNVHDNLHYGYKLVAEKDRRLAFKQIVDLLEIGNLQMQKPHQLSGGEKQRVALGRALLTSPRLLLLDEPLASLDIRLKQQILPFLSRVKNEIQLPIIYVSHAIDEILTLTSQVMMIDQGKLLAMGDFYSVIQQPRLLAMASTLGLENVYRVTVAQHYPDEGYTSTKLGQQTLAIPLVKAEIGDTLTVTIAANHVVLALAPIQQVTIQNQLVGTVIAIQQIDYRVLVTVDISKHQLIAEINIKGLKLLEIEVGKKVVCLFKASCLAKAQAIDY